METQFKVRSNKVLLSETDGRKENLHAIYRSVQIYHTNRVLQKASCLPAKKTAPANSTEWKTKDDDSE